MTDEVEQRFSDPFTGHRLAPAAMLEERACRAVQRGCADELTYLAMLSVTGSTGTTRLDELIRRAAGKPCRTLGRARGLLEGPGGQRESTWLGLEYGGDGTFAVDSPEKFTDVITVPVWAECNAPLGGHDPLHCVELLAVDPDDHSRWWQHHGGLSLLGWLEAEMALGDGRPIRVFASPVAWLNATETVRHEPAWARVCVLDWSCEWSALTPVCPRDLLCQHRAPLVLDSEGEAAELAALRDRLRRADMAARWPMPKLQFLKGEQP